jgi:hypothetical protein
MRSFQAALSIDANLRHGEMARITNTFLVAQLPLGVLLFHAADNLAQLQGTVGDAVSAPGWEANSFPLQIYRSFISQAPN